MPKIAQPRREVTDQTILKAAVLAVGKFGAAVTLTQIGREAGLSPGRLVQRFGSRQRLIRSAIEDGAEQNLRLLSQVAKSSTPVASFLEWVARGSRVTPDEAARVLEWLLAARRDRGVRSWYTRYLARLHTRMVAILDAGVRAGELERTDTAALAVRIQHVWFGQLAVLVLEPKRVRSAAIGAVVADLLRPLLVKRR